jgi:tRNA (cmo5U34)-methyltransferase
MGVGAHLRIELEEYDSRIRTFVPNYEDLVRVAAEALQFVAVPAPGIIDLGVGTGALAEACLTIRPGATVLGVDSDPGMLQAARVRLARFPRVDLIEANFLSADLPACDAIVACISLHHVRTPAAKRALYTKCCAALRPSGLLVSADCFPAAQAGVAAQHREAWLAHLEASYGRAQAEAYLSSWSAEDVYYPLDEELGWLREAGLEPEVLWRVEGFAVIAAFRGPA